MSVPKATHNQGATKLLLSGLLTWRICYLFSHLHIKRIQFSSLIYLWFPKFADLWAYFSLIAIHWFICRYFKLLILIDLAHQPTKHSLLKPILFRRVGWSAEGMTLGWSPRSVPGENTVVYCQNCLFVMALRHIATVPACSRGSSECFYSAATIECHALGTRSFCRIIQTLGRPVVVLIAKAERQLQSKRHNIVFLRLGDPTNEQPPIYNQWPDNLITPILRAFSEVVPMVNWNDIQTFSA